MSIYKKLLSIQKQVIGLAKNKKSINYQYVDGSKVLDHIKPLMNDLGLILKQEILSIDNERMDYKTGIGTQHEKEKSEILSKVMMKFTWIDCESGEKDENLFGANGQNDWEKGLGSALTYAERYFLLKFFHIETDADDIDNPNRKESEPKAEPKQKPIFTMANFEKARQANATIEQIESKYQIDEKTKQDYLKFIKIQLWS
jgi:ribosome assembly protein YihI (activator of Der GTPase)